MTKLDAKVSWLFETEALVISPAEKPFWYTSGLIGPYYINTHFLCGGKECADSLLEKIDEGAGDPESFIPSFSACLKQVFEQHPIYADAIRCLAQQCREELPIEEISFVSGGQRRDWFFSPMLAMALDKPPLYIYSDGKIYDEDGREPRKIGGACVLNVADLLTVGSSYTEKWIPALAEKNARLSWSAQMVDRRQGGCENLYAAGIEQCISLFQIDQAFFASAEQAGLISAAQRAVVEAYLEDPMASMRSFLLQNPSFVAEAQQSPDQRIRKRAALLIDNDLYGIR